MNDAAPDLDRPASDARPPDIASLPTLDPGTSAILHRPTGLLIVSRGGLCVSGSREDLARLAAEITAACWEARKPSPNPPGTRRAYQGEDQ